MKKRLWFQLFWPVCALLCLLAPPIFAATKDSAVTVRIAPSTVDTHLLLWALPNSGEQPDMAALFDQSDAQLTAAYHHPLEAVINKGTSEVLLTNLADGVSYYVREAEGVTKDEVLVPFVVTVTVGRDQLVQAKKTTPQKRGSYQFVKVSSQGGTLQGASFEVWQSLKGKAAPVLKAGKPYLVTSDNKGLFEVADLPFGSYYLKEIKAPKGYLLSPKTVAFEVTNYSAKAKPTSVINTPKTPPPGIEVPYTGNAVMIVVALIGFAMFMLGAYLVKRDKKRRPE
ncbi:MSCRAMM family protein [Streptococcus phocae subsp. salmonis]|uniref:MSCRAMM family protein n=1 Tax=Streptococcus phocae TaxID=119224 RepID=UPI0005321B6B|nr:prealbumin-like fold domain-containing protein [Streptococcus phocae]KGR72791.1 cell wall anchor protein [Streptococcus phocae subsp. salmonis]